MGDYADSITKNDKRFDSNGLAPWVKKEDIIHSQEKWLETLFRPIADKGICLITGNHEETVHHEHQNDITRHLCEDLKLPYGGYHSFIVLTFRRQTYADTRKYVIDAWHGSGAAQTEGARLNRLMRLVNDIQAHIYLMGHLHAMTSHTPDRLIVEKGKVKSIRLAATLTGSWLTTYTQPDSDLELSPSYGEMKGYKPSRIGCPVIHIDPSADAFTIES